MDREHNIPNDLAECQRRLIETQHVAEETAASYELLVGEHERLQEEFATLKRMLFGPRRERMRESPDQQYLFDRGAEPLPPNETTEEEPVSRRRRRGRASREFPDHLPRRRVELDVAESQKLCACCGKPLVRIGEDVSEVLDCEPVKLFVWQYVRAKYACSGCKDGVTSPPPAHKPVAGGRYGFGVCAEVLSSKYAYHSTLYRQQDMFASSGVSLTRSTLCDIVKASAELLVPLVERMRAAVLESSLMWTDDTIVPMLIKGGTQRARFWTYIGDQQHSYDVYDFTINRSRDGPVKFLKGYSGYLHADAYGGYDGIYLDSGGSIIEVTCWSHARRKFYDAKSSNPREAHQVLAWINHLFDIEDQARQMTSAERLALRCTASAGVLQRIRDWLDRQTHRALPKSNLGKAITYAQNQWDALCRYTDDGRLTIDNNASERRMRHQAIGRKNWLFVGGEEPGHRAATIYTVISSARRHELDIWAYLRDVLDHLAREDVDLDALLPDRWKQSHPEHVHIFRIREREAQATARQERRRRQRAFRRAQSR